MEQEVKPCVEPKATQCMPFALLIMMVFAPLFMYHPPIQETESGNKDLVNAYEDVKKKME